MAAGAAGQPGLSSMHLIKTGHLCCLRSPCARSRKRLAFTCQSQTPSRNSSTGVVMRELHLPGSSDTAANNKEFKRAKPAPRADNGVRNITPETSTNNAARRVSGREASTSSPSSITFQASEKATLARTYSGAARRTQQMLRNDTYDATLAVDQAVPGFAAASRKAAATTEQRAESLIDAGQSEHLPLLLPCDHFTM